MGLPVDIMIFAGKSEAHCASILAIDGNTKVHIDPRLKS
jgi:predicted Holliday junction resolvase-like endonuclease